MQMREQRRFLYGLEKYPKILDKLRAGISCQQSRHRIIDRSLKISIPKLGHYMCQILKTCPPIKTWHGPICTNIIGQYQLQRIANHRRPAWGDSSPFGISAEIASES
jgi:hypothetical protein